MRDLQKALAEVDMTYDQLQQIQVDLVKRSTQSSDQLINTVMSMQENLTNDQIRKYMLDLSLNQYSFSEIKERSQLKQECAEIIRKEQYANQFNQADGSVAQRENVATINSSEQILTEAVYEMVSSTLKTKLDELHRVVDVLKTIIMSRMSEAKLTSISDGIQEN